MDKCSTWRRLEGLWTTFGVAANFFKFWHKPADLFRFMDNFRREIIETWRPLQVYGQFSTNDTNLQTSSGWWTTFGPATSFYHFLTQTWRPWKVYGQLSDSKHIAKNHGDLCRFMDNVIHILAVLGNLKTFSGLWTIFKSNEMTWEFLSLNSQFSPDLRVLGSNNAKALILSLHWIWWKVPQSGVSIPISQEKDTF